MEASRDEVFPINCPNGTTIFSLVTLPLRHYHYSHPTHLQPLHAYSYSSFFDAGIHPGTSPAL
jgi:hypothetical protein